MQLGLNQPKPPSPRHVRSGSRSSTSRRFAKRSNGVEALPLGKGLETFTTAALATLVRTLCLQAFLAATTAFISVTSADPTLLAAHLVLKQFYIIMSFVTDALAIAAQQLVASATSTLESRKRATRLLGWGFVTGVVLAALFYVIPPSLLTDDARVARRASIELLRIVAPLQLLSSLVFVGDGILQGSRDFKFEAFAVARWRRSAAPRVDPGTAAARRRAGDGVGRRRRAERPAVFDVRRALLSERTSRAGRRVGRGGAGGGEAVAVHVVLS